MGLAFRTATEADLDEIFAVDARAFGLHYGPEDVAAHRRVLELDRFQLAVDDGTLVGLAGAFSQELTLPGGACLPMAGVTWVSVAVTHRRRGLLRRLLEAVHADTAARGEPVVGLTASEGGIYRRFGYGVATWLRATDIDRRQAGEVALPAPGTVRLLGTGEPRLVDLLAERYDRYRRGQPGEVSRSEDWFRLLLHQWGGDAVIALHADGYAAWTVERRWVDGRADFTLTLGDLVAATDDAHEALWSTVLAVDLVATVRSAGDVAPDDPLLHRLADARAVRTTALYDHLWLRVPEPATAFAARAYRTDDRIRIGSGGRVLAVEPGRCRPTDEDADLELDPADLGPVLLGGVRPSVLVRAGRARAASPHLLGRADAFLGWDPLPHNRTAF